MAIELIALLREIQQLAGSGFSGAGILVSDKPEVLPLLPLRSLPPSGANRPVAEVLAELCQNASPFHDGFHVLSSRGELTLFSQYFSPPIQQEIPVNRSKRIGSRYMAALFGSALPAVQLIGTCSKDSGLAVFRDGKEIFFEESKCLG